jgi:hypothetical protein
MAQYIPLAPGHAQFPTTNFPSYVRISGTNFPVEYLAYDASTDETAFWKIHLLGYTSGNITLTIGWNSQGSQTSGTVVWEAQIAAVTPETDTGSIESKSLATLNFVQDTHLGTTALRLMECTLTISNLDSAAANDVVWLRVARDANATNATDSMTGDAGLAYVIVSYS